MPGVKKRSESEIGSDVSFSCPYSRTSDKMNSRNFACSAFSEVRLRKTAPLQDPQNVHGHLKSRAPTTNTMPIVATFHTSERTSGTPAAPSYAPRLSSWSLPGCHTLWGVQPGGNPVA